MVIYFITSMLLLAISAFILFEHITITAGSIVPIVLIAVSVLQAVIFKSHENEKGQDYTNSTMFSANNIDNEATKLSMKFHALTKIAIIPLLCMFIIYLDTTWKIVLPIIIYIISFMPIRLLVKLSQRNK